jgi:choline dehydrogenase-like flavoprotein
VLRSAGLVPFAPDSLSCGSESALSDEYFRCFVRAWANTCFHPVGTCAMGKVVDNKLR